MQIVSNGDNLHEMSNPDSVKNKKHIINLSSAESAQRVVKVSQSMGKMSAKAAYNKVFLQTHLYISYLPI